MTLLIIFAVAAVVLSIAAIIFVLFYGEQIKKQAIPTIKPVSGSSKKNSRVYEMLSSTAFIGPYLQDIKSKLLINSRMNEYTARRKVLFVTTISATASLIIFFFTVRLYGSSLYMKIVMLVYSLYLNSFLINLLTGKGGKLLESLTDFINDVKHYYHALNMVDEAIYEATIRADSVMEMHGKEVYGIITSSGGEKKLEEYYEGNPNKFLKILAGFSYMVKEYGDKKINGVSLYIKNLNYIIEEVYLEIVKKSQLEYWLKGLPVIVLLPILFPPWIENWMSSSFPASKEFFQSSTAFFLKNIIIFLIIACYVFVNRLPKSDSKRKKVKTGDSTFEQSILKLYWVKGFIGYIKPKISSLRYKNLVKLLQESGSSLSVEIVYLRKLLCGVTAFILFLAIFVTAHSVNVHAILNNSAYGIKSNNLYLMLGKVPDGEQADRDKINRYDETVLKFFQKLSANLTDADIVAKIKAELDAKGYTLGDTQVAAERINSKLKATAAERLKLWEVFISLLLTFAFSNIPVWILLFEKALRKADMQDEVFQFHTVILLLMHHKSVDVRKVLEWMLQLSDVFREAINRCLNNFHNPKQALHQLKEDVKYKDFIYLIENLEMANDRISIQEAFDSLELDRDFYRENRKEINKRTVSSRIELGKFIGFIPFYATILLYLVLPLMFISFTSLQAIIQQLANK